VWCGCGLASVDASGWSVGCCRCVGAGVLVRVRWCVSVGAGVLMWVYWCGLADALGGAGVMVFLVVRMC
jgi:hypothetical protein